jgi:hypothetical protein
MANSNCLAGVQGFIYSACDGMIFYLERCFVAAESQWGSPAPEQPAALAPPPGLALPSEAQGSGPASPRSLVQPRPSAEGGGRGNVDGAAAGSNGSLQVQHLAPEHSCWLLELLSGLGCLACLGSLTKPCPAVYLPQPATQLLQSMHPLLPAELHWQADSIQARSQPVQQLQRLWQHLAWLLASSISHVGGAAPWAVGRLALCSGALLASLAVRGIFGEEKGISAEVPGALYAALRSAGLAVPALLQLTERLEREERVGGLVRALQALASQIGTSVMQVS